MITFSQLESSLYFNRFIQKDIMEYSRNLTSYAHMINDNNDLQRLKYLINDLKDKEVLVDIMIDDND